MDGEGSLGTTISEDKRRIKLAVVIVGIALFVLGFMITVSSLSSNGTGSNDARSGALSTGGESSPITLLMILGMVVSLFGVLLATVGPMASFIQGKDR